jgi:carbon storage regulator
MLVLSRKKDERIVINNDITIVVVEIRGDKVRLGVEAPKEVPVHRREVYDAIARGEPVDLIAEQHSADTPAESAVPIEHPRTADHQSVDPS